MFDKKMFDKKCLTKNVQGSTLLTDCHQPCVVGIKTEWLQNVENAKKFDYGAGFGGGEADASPLTKTGEKVGSVAFHAIQHRDRLCAVEKNAGDQREVSRILRFLC